MGAKFVNEAEAAFGIAKRNKPLREQFYPHRRAVVFGEFLGQQCRQPIAAKQSAHRGTGTGLRQKIILFFSEHDSVVDDGCTTKSRDSRPAEQDAAACSPARAADEIAC